MNECANGLSTIYFSAIFSLFINDLKIVTLYSNVHYLYNIPP